MAKKYNFKHNNMDMAVTMEDEDDADFIVEIDPVEGLSGGGNFTLIKPIADLKLKKRSGSSSQDYEKVKFKKTMKVEVTFTDDVVKTLNSKGKTLNDLELGYLIEDTKGSGTGTWYAFSDPAGVPKVKTKIDANRRTGTVKIKDWMIDPGLGWGTK
ncbi:MAG: hypothetical protein P8Y68_19255 [Anaerolineales bacterium]